MHKILLLFAFFAIQFDIKSQDTAGLLIRYYDTIDASAFQPKKVVVFKLYEVSLLLDFDSVRKKTVELTDTRQYRNTTAKRILADVDKQINRGDTAYMDQRCFDRLNWIPYDFFLYYQIQKGKCLVRDSNNVIHRKISYAYAEKTYSGKRWWGGILFFLPGMNRWFFEYTKWEAE